MKKTKFQCWLGRIGDKDVFEASRGYVFKGSTGEDSVTKKEGGNEGAVMVGT